MTTFQKKLERFQAGQSDLSSRERPERVAARKRRQDKILQENKRFNDRMRFDQNKLWEWNK